MAAIVNKSTIMRERQSNIVRFCFLSIFAFLIISSGSFVDFRWKASSASSVRKQKNRIDQETRNVFTAKRIIKYVSSRETVECQFKF